eukprot:jgi/Tetstr1/426895/TSEL_017108.t1
MAAAVAPTTGPPPLCTHVNHEMESDDPAVAAMHLAYAATFDPSCMCGAPHEPAARARATTHVFHGARAAARAATCEFCKPPPTTAPPPGVALPASAAGASTLRLLPQPPMMPPSRLPLGADRTLAYADRFPPTDDRSYMAEGAVCVFAGLLLRPYPSISPAAVRKLAKRRVRLYEAGDAVRAGFSVCGMQQLWRESRDGSELHNYHMETGELPAGTSRSARRRKRRRSARARATFAKAAEGAGADAAADGVPPAVVDAHRRAAKLTVVLELRRARHPLDTADLGMVSNAAAALPVLEALHPPPAPTNPEYSPPEDPPDMRRAPPSWGGNADEVRRGTVFALHKDDPAVREERAKAGEPL